MPSTKEGSPFSCGIICEQSDACKYFSFNAVVQTCYYCNTEPTRSAHGSITYKKDGKDHILMYSQNVIASWSTISHFIPTTKISLTWSFCIASTITFKDSFRYGPRMMIQADPKGKAVHKCVG